MLIPRLEAGFTDWSCFKVDKEFSSSASRVESQQVCPPMGLLTCVEFVYICLFFKRSACTLILEKLLHC